MIEILRKPVLAASALFLAAVGAATCSKPATESTPAPARSALIAEITPVVSVKELMENMIDPLSDNIFDAVWWDNTAKGIEEHKPVTDEDWEKVKTGAVGIVE